MSTKEFTRRVREKNSDAPPKVVEFALTTDREDENGEIVIVRSDEMKATKPSDEQMFLFIAATGDDVSDGNYAAAVLRLLKVSLRTKDYRILVSRLNDTEDEVDNEMLAEVVEYLFEEWETLPTQPSGASAPTPDGTGGNSTGRSRGKASNSSTSRSPRS